MTRSANEDGFFSLLGRPFKWLFSALAAFAVLCLVAAVVLLIAWRSATSVFTPLRTSRVEVRPSVDLVVAVREIARLETTEVQVEKVVDLADQQSVFFGLIEAKDAMLLVASGKATIGVDLGTLANDDVTFDPETKSAKLRLPPPAVLAVSLDEEKTYVYTRSTDTLAKRNEHLETRARREAVKAIEKAAHDPELMARARTQTERQLKALLLRFGVHHVDITWK